MGESWRRDMGQYRHKRRLSVQELGEPDPPADQRADSFNSLELDAEGCRINEHDALVIVRRAVRHHGRPVSCEDLYGRITPKWFAEALARLAAAGQVVWDAEGRLSPAVPADQLARA